MPTPRQKTPARKKPRRLKRATLTLTYSIPTCIDVNALEEWLYNANCALRNINTTSFPKKAVMHDAHGRRHHLYLV